MKEFRAAFWFEFLKARRSKVLLFTFLGFSILPIVSGFFMIVLKTPGLATKLGLFGAKAQILAYKPDWTGMFGILTQGTAIGGMILFSIIASWVIGREFSDHTVKDLLAVPTSRPALVAAKLLLIFLWSAAIVVFIALIGLLIGLAVGLPGLTPEVFASGIKVLFVSSLLSIALVTPVAFAASAGRGYLPPIGFAVFTLILGMIFGATGWGIYVPWSIPALYTGAAGTQGGTPNAVSYVLVSAVCIAGIIATFTWWRYADQTK